MVFPDARIAFRSRFRVVPGETTLDLRAHLTELIRQCVAHECGIVENGVGGSFFDGGPWFASGGGWGGKDRPGVDIRTRVNPGRFAVDDPLEWAVRADSPDPASDFRRWRTEVYVRRPDGDEAAEDGGRWLEVQYKRLWSIRPGFIGPEPEPPEDAAPEMLRELTDESAWRAMSGPVRLAPESERLVPGRVNDLVDVIADAARTCPIVAVGYDPQTARPILDPDLLAEATAGAAAVVELMPNVDAELAELLPDDMRCGNEFVRVFMPVRGGGMGHPAAHRYFTARRVREDGAAEVTAQIIRGCARRCPELLKTGVRTVEDVERAAALYAADSGPEPDATAEQRLQAATAEFENRLEEAFRQAQAAREQTESLRAELNDLQRVQSGYRPFEKTADDKRPEWEERKLPGYAAVMDAVAARGLGIASLSDAVDLVAGLFPGRIAFSDEARQSAADAGFNSLKTARSAATRLLWHLATTMYDLYFVDGAADYEREFKERTGIEFSAQERRATNRKKQSQRARTLRFEGKTYDITPHLKLGSDPKTGLRVHFAVDNGPPKRIVVGHVGDHLVTAGTQKLH